MRALIQRVLEGSVTVAGSVVGRTGPGLVILVCAMPGDTVATAARLAEKIARLRVFRDDQGRMNLSLLDTGGGALVVSQFTLAADTSRGNRPGFSGAAEPGVAEALYGAFADHLAGMGVAVGRGMFGAEMQVALVNDGPVTIWLDTAG
jgi:D-tyrosyl-tRNA(Tyr) deacylase